MVGVDISSLNLPRIRDDLRLRDGETEEVREFNIRTLLGSGYSVLQANYIAEWAMKNANWDVNTPPQPIRNYDDNPYTGEDQVQMGHDVVSGVGNGMPFTAAMPRINVNRVDRVPTNPNAPAFLGGAGGTVQDSTSLPSNPNELPANELAPKNRGYRGSPAAMPSGVGDNLPEGPIINPPPEMQDRVLTMGELETIRRERGHVAGYEGVETPNRQEQDNEVPQGSNLPGTPETATDSENVREFDPEAARDNPQLKEPETVEESARTSVQPNDLVSSQRERSVAEEAQREFFAQHGESDATSTGEQSASNQPEHPGTPPSAP